MNTEITNAFKLTGSVAIVTGGGAGIGRAIAIMFARSGAKVVVSDLKEETAKAVADEIKAIGGEATGLACDVTNEDALVDLVDRTVEAFGKVTILVNNAGVAARSPST
jgi:7-alpha-hydroxysteroid dehydrogenase